MEVAAEFADRIDTVDQLDTLATLLEAATRDLGFRYVALVDHGGPARASPARLFLQNYPVAWVETFQAKALHRLDPVHRLASVRLDGFGWNCLPRLLDLSPVQQSMLGDSRRAGLGDGFTVPLHAPAGRTASCSFVTGTERPLPRNSLFAAEFLARSAFAVAMRLLGPELAAARLTPRQRECVTLMAQGKSDWEIGRILELSEESVTKYLNAARSRFGVARRTQLALAAVASGEIGFDEIVTWQ